MASITSTMKSTMKKMVLPLTERSQVALDAVSSATATKILDLLLTLIPNLHMHYARYDEVDASIYAYFLSAIRSAPPIKIHETALVDKSLTYDDQAAELDRDAELQRTLADRNLVGLNVFLAASWKRIPHTVTSPVAYYQNLVNGSSAWGKAVTIVDVGADYAMSYVWNLHAYEHAQRHISREGVDALNRIAYAPDSHSMLRANIVNFGMATRARVFSTWFVWRQEDDGVLTIAFAPMADYKQFNSATVEINNALSDDDAAANAVPGTVKGFWRFRPLAPDVCQITYVAQTQVGGTIPKSLLNKRLKNTLSAVHNMRNKFMRNGRVADRQVREALGKQFCCVEDLSPDQRAIYQNSCALEEGLPAQNIMIGTQRRGRRGISLGSSAESTFVLGERTSKAARVSLTGALGLPLKESSWQELPSPSHLVTMGMQYKATRRGQDPTVLAQAETTVDCKKEDAFAWFMMAAGRERTRHHLEHGDLAHVQLRERSDHDRTTATIRKTPFRLTSREYVTRSVGVASSLVSLAVAFSSEDVGKIDYGQSFRVVRGHMSGLVKIETVANLAICKVTFIVQWSGKGNLPVWAIQAEIDKTLSVVNELRTEFQRDDEIDDTDLARLAHDIVKSKQSYTQEEDAMIGRVKLKLRTTLKEADFDTLESPDHLVSMGRIFLEASGLGIGRAGVTVDVSIEECAAWEMAVMNRERVKVAGSLRASERSLTRINDHHGVFRFVVDFEVPGLKPREMIQSLIWKWGKWGDKLVVVYDTLENNKNFTPNPAYVLANATGFYEYEKLKPLEGFPQTRVTWTQQVDLKGFVPKFVVNGQAVNQLMHLSAMRRRFDKSPEIDKEAREGNVAMIEDHSDSARRAMGERPIKYSSEEKSVLACRMNDFDLFDGRSAKPLKLNSTLTTAKIAYKDGESPAWGYSVTTVRASAAEVRISRFS